MHLLLVEDNPDDALIVHEHLVQRDTSPYRLTHAATLAEARDLVENGTFDAILLDMHLPDGRGAGLVANLRDSAPGVPIIVLTGLDDEALTLEAIHAGAQDFFFKGRIRGSELSRAIQYALERERTERALRASEARQRALIDKNLDGIVVVDRDGVIAFANPAAEDLLCRPREALVGEALGLVTVAGGIGEIEILRPDGSPSTVETRCADIEWEGKSAMFVALRDITERRQMERALRNAAVVFDHAGEGVMVTDDHQRILAVNRAFSRITGYPRDEVIGADPRILRSDLHDAAFRAEVWRSVLQTGSWQGEMWSRRKDGEVYPEWCSISAVRDEDGAITNFVTIFSDISAIKQSEEHLEYLAHHDPLTELPNRLLFTARLNHALARRRRQGGNLALMFLDLDRFKTFNDSLGHAAGDALLQGVAKRLAGALRSEDTVARLGGDEFICLIEGLTDAHHAGLVARKLLAALADPFEILGRETYVTTSAGISVFPDDGEDAETLVKNADAAMYRAKELGRNNYQFYTAELTSAALDRLTLEAELHRALENGELVLYYQPQVSAANGAVLGVEALVRWQHPKQGSLSPAVFLPLAEETGCVCRITDWVLAAACAQMQQWLTAGLPVRRIGVNLSGKDFARPDLTDRIRETLRACRLPAEYLELEVTEGFFLQRTEVLMKNLEQLRSLGVALAMDDFGTGYSSLGYLKHIPLDRLKIDRSFVQDLPGDLNDAAISRAVIAMGHSLGLSVTAEGVETEEQAAFLKAEGCDELQGYFYGEPMKAEALAAKIAEGVSG